MHIVAVSFIMFLLTVTNQITAQSRLSLWYDKPAAEWVEAVPVGNGHIGGMVFGRVAEELIQLNESTLYSGGPVKQQINPDAFQYLSRIREALLKEQDYTKANELARKMQGYFTESYMPMGDLGAGDPVWANWYMGGNWLCQYLWEHYAFTQDKKFLAEAYPVMKQAALFSLDWLVKDSSGY